ncbi:hypothetical protein RHP75_06730 [Pseudomonas sp. SG20056]|uniref:hypothetical protein n=1 Tax=Pseudomonas sp. SG20056 TaxID=3074146 RepID=UPI00287F9EDC|nr:hypothetical protein [Pseudomonas sp. SG20056]WNF48117.1 hypothetical protein RHP75_06730 [Pseudomonas sp. SG20056]
MDNIALEILAKVDAFYSSAFSQLLAITLGIIAFAGVFVPILTTYYQNRNIKIEKQNLEDYIANKVNNLKEELTLNLNYELQEKLAEFEKKQEAKTDKIIAGLLHVQASLQLSNSHFKHATSSIISSIERCISAGDELNLSRGFSILIEQCLPEIKPEEEINLENLAIKIEGIHNKMSKLNSGGRYSDVLSELKRAHKKTIVRLSETER